QSTGGALVSKKKKPHDNRSGSPRSRVMHSSQQPSSQSGVVDAHSSLTASENSNRHGAYRRLLSVERLRPTTDETRKSDTELEAISDRGRIVRSSPFRRLQSKAQVFSMARSGDVRTR